MKNCELDVCPYGKKGCMYCLHYNHPNLPKTKRKKTPTGLDTSDMTAYRREYMRKKRAEELRHDMERAGVA